MQLGMKQQDLAVASGYWPLFRYNPAMRDIGENPFLLDSPRPTIKFRDYAYNETRYRALAQTRPAEAEALMAAAQAATGREVPQLRGDGRLVGIALPSGGAAKRCAECAGCRNDVRACVILPLPLREGAGGRGRTIAGHAVGWIQSDLIPRSPPPTPSRKGRGTCTSHQPHDPHARDVGTFARLPSSDARHRYHAAIERNGAHASPISANAFGFG